MLKIMVKMLRFVKVMARTKALTLAHWPVIQQCIAYVVLIWLLLSPALMLG